MRLIDADANIETMKKCAENPESEQAWLCYRFAQRILEEAPTVEPASPWHRVEDELPKYGQDVLAARLYGADSDGWAYEVIIAHVCEVRGTNYWNATNVTHWMPLPEPPKED